MLCAISPAIWTSAPRISGRSTIYHLAHSHALDRWDVHQVMWTGGMPYLLTSYEDILSEEAMDNLMIVHGTFPDGPPQYFLCPMLPVK